MAYRVVSCVSMPVLNGATKFRELTRRSNFQGQGPPNRRRGPHRRFCSARNRADR